MSVARGSVSDNNVRETHQSLERGPGQTLLAVVGARGAQEGRALSGPGRVPGRGRIEVDHGRVGILCKQRVKAKGPRGEGRNKIREL